MTHRQESSDSIPFSTAKRRVVVLMCVYLARRSSFEVSSSLQLANNPEYWAQSRSPGHNFTSVVRFTDVGWKRREVDRLGEL